MIAEPLPEGAEAEKPIDRPFGSHGAQNTQLCALESANRLEQGRALRIETTINDTRAIDDIIHDAGLAA